MEQKQFFMGLKWPIISELKRNLNSARCWPVEVRMKVVGLTSGGKDSCYSLMMCMKDGHDVVCLANLHPPNGSEEEMDSYMYQCVAHTGLQVIFFSILLNQTLKFLRPLVQTFRGNL